MTATRCHNSGPWFVASSLGNPMPYGAMSPHGARRQYSSWVGIPLVPALLVLLVIVSSSQALLLRSAHRGAATGLELGHDYRHPRRQPTTLTRIKRKRRHWNGCQRSYMVKNPQDDEEEEIVTTTTPSPSTFSAQKRRSRLSLWPRQSWPKSAFRRRPWTRIKHETLDSSAHQIHPQHERGRSSIPNTLAENSTPLSSVDKEPPSQLVQNYTLTKDSDIVSNTTIKTDNVHKDTTKASTISVNNNRTLPTPAAESSSRKWPASPETLGMEWNVPTPALPKPFLNFLPNKGTSKSLVSSATGKKESDPVTSEDLERIVERLLLEKGWTRPTTHTTPLRSSDELPGLGQPVSDRRVGASSSNVAFPQPSVLNYKSLQFGITAAAWLCGTLIAASVHPSLWLVGGLAGSWYGYAVVASESLAAGVVPTSVIPALLVAMGRRLATWYLQTWDFITAMFFMYKTGQLSYSMWRQYAQVDERFQIQDKLDAWNAFFVKGKENFDKWEKENEVGRKVLATMRTVWLVEERSLKKSAQRRRRRQSRYRLVQAIYDLAYLAGRSLANLLRFLTGGGTSQELSEFLKGVRLDISAARLDSIGSRIGVISAALIAVNIVGALYAISPSFVMMLAITFSIVWPSWLPELLERCQNLAEEIRAKGRGEENDEPSNIRGVNKSRYHFYIDRAGKRRYYRIQTNPFQQQQDSPSKNKFRWPWERPRAQKSRL